ncbi:hypothetical protein HMPREF0012_01329 [Acinetobacter calcoaceticus RUH2202]|uniref:hypothetical protein n=1 Tax=Acinetobacter TaxID=469 RepID=UPI0001BB4C42|nr:MULTISPECIES: hypothetical protein [Acinetobacter]EEY78460.1 hypothetical protein HMPREF0012_01329 [Acinetobacter calcoaceticus RUH2202]MBI1447406.1 hypothetical protein [Acinetobacter sp. AC1-2]CAI3139801.1 hypothetical protein MWMV18_MWMV18_01186 [Acinetobacter calcoaceticus]
MKKTKSIVVLAITACMLSGCLQMFPPTVAEVNPGVYQLHAQSNAFGSREALRSKLIGKAEEICKDKGFDELDSNNKIVNHHTVYNSGLLIPVNTKAAVLKVKCKD